jgi:Uma2 family endonuclease
MMPTGPSRSSIVAPCNLAVSCGPSVRLLDDGHSMGLHMAQPARTSAMMTADEFLAYPLPDAKGELVRGELRVTPPPGGPHGVASTNLVMMLGLHTRPLGLGRAFADGVGYELIQLPHTVRVPDGSFVRADRLPAAGIGPGLLRLAPDLAIEVLSPGETASSLEEKLDDYLQAGTPLLWIVDPMRRTVMIVSADAPVRWLHEGDTLDGASVVPGFVCAVSDIFEGIARESSA